MRSIRASAERARSEAETAVQLQRMQTERAAAIAALAEVTGRPLAKPSLTVAGAKRHADLVQAYGTAAEEYKALAERGLKAVEQIELGTARPRELRGLQAQLRRSIDEMKRYEDEYIVNEQAGKPLPQ